MEIIVKGAPEEIAALVTELQERRGAGGRVYHRIAEEVPTPISKATSPADELAQVVRQAIDGTKKEKS